MSLLEAQREQTRARYPDEEGYVEREGVRVFWERYGDGPTTILFFPTSPISHSRLWKAQIPFLARHYRVLAFDPRGNGRSDRPTDAAAYGSWEFVEDGRAVLEAGGAERAILVGLCDGGGWALMLASTHPEMALGVAAIAPAVPYLTPTHPNYTRYPFDEPLEVDEGWAKYNIHYWRRDFRGFLEFFFSQQLPEPHSTKQIEDCVEWGLGTDPETLALADEGPLPWASADEARAVCERISCPVLVLHGELDQCQTRERAEAVAHLTGGSFVGLEGCGHLPQARHPVIVNLLIRDFAKSLERRAS
jgi:pimeloyl-ACP methyl ester carboxylesterase